MDEDAKEMQDLNKRPHYTWIDGRNPCAPLVVTPLDKFGDRFGLVCKRLYDHLMFEWLEGPSYQKETNMSEKEIVTDLNTYAVTNKLADFEVDSDEEDEDRPATVPTGYATLSATHPRGGPPGRGPGVKTHTPSAKQ